MRKNSLVTLTTLSLVLLISGCIQQQAAPQQYVCQNGAIVSNPLLCPKAEFACQNGSKVTDLSECPKPQQLRADYNNIQTCIFCEHISVNKDVVTINLTKLRSEPTAPTSIWVNIDNVGETSLGRISAGVSCTEPKPDLIPSYRMQCFPGNPEKGCYIDDLNANLTVWPLNFNGGTTYWGGMAVFYWDSEKLKQLTSPDSINCELRIWSAETLENYYKKIKIEFVN